MDIRPQASAELARLAERSGEIDEHRCAVLPLYPAARRSAHARLENPLAR